MTTFSSRPTGYKLGVVGLFLVTIVFIVGFAAPYWYENHHLLPNPDSASGHQGLWVICLSNSMYYTDGFYYDGCHSITKRSYPEIREWSALFHCF